MESPAFLSQFLVRETMSIYLTRLSESLGGKGSQSHCAGWKTEARNWKLVGQHGSRTWLFKLKFNTISSVPQLYSLPFQGLVNQQDTWLVTSGRDREAQGVCDIRQKVLSDGAGEKSQAH